VNCIDLFAGAGGFSHGARLAGLQVLWAANHWPTAVQWHSANHPHTGHACQDLQQFNFTEAPAHDVLLASPACQGHSPARGADRPHHDAQRATAWAVITCAEVHRPAAVVVENVPHFARWQLYPAWCAAMHALGYALAPQIIDAADHDTPQHRRRLIIVATRTRHPIDLQLQPRSHIPASAVIDFTAGSWQPVARKVAATRQRVANGRAAFGAQFVMPYYGSGSGRTGRSLARPIGTITTRARWGVVNGDVMRMVSRAENQAFMGFPADYQLPDSDTEANHLLGNAVPPQLARAVLSQLRQRL
jgi:DNA (cytosine-5)-methyltransferase 1